MQKRCPLYLHYCIYLLLSCPDLLPVSFIVGKENPNKTTFSSARLDQEVSRLPIWCYLSSLQEAESRKHPSEVKKSLNPKDGCEVNVKQAPTAAHSLALIGLKLPKLSPLRTQYCSVDKVGELRHNKELDALLFISARAFVERNILKFPLSQGK